jgi:pSer/pThr/pTyr-binding forkhead associated (FHA) protein
MSRVCPSCGSGAGAGFARCPDCGAMMDAGSGAAAPTVAAAGAEAPTVVTGPPSRSAAGAHLFVKSGPDQGRLFPLADLVTVGRSAGCDIRLADPHVSSRHAQLKREAAAYVYLDLRSSSGSFLQVGGGEQLLRAAHTFADNDQIRLGETVLQFIRTPHGGKQ